MDKIFKEMSLCNKYYDSDFYAIAIDKYNKKNERRVEFYKKAKSEKSKIWVKDVLDCTRFKDYAGAITHLEKTYDCEIEYISSDRGDYDYMICHVVLERGLPVGFSYLNFKAKSSVKYTYPPTVTNLSNNDPIPPEYIHDLPDNCNLSPIPLSEPALQLFEELKSDEEEKKNFETLLSECEKDIRKKQKNKKKSASTSNNVEDDSLNNKKVYDYYVIKLDKSEYLQGFTDYGFDTTDHISNAWKSSLFESAYNYMRCLSPNEIFRPCENDDPDALYMIEKIRQYPNGDVFVVDAKTYKIIKSYEEW